MIIDNKERQRKINYATWITVISNFLLALFKIILGLRGNSLSLISDGVDSSTDVVSSIAILIASRFMLEPPDKQHPWGHQRAEVIVSKILSFIILFSGLEILTSSIRKLFNPSHLELSINHLILIGSLISILTKFLLVILLINYSKKIDSMMLRSNAKNMFNDIILSSSVFISLLTIYFGLSPKIDVIVACFIALWIIYSAITIFIETSQEVMDSMRNPEIYRKIFDAVDKISEISNPHRVRVRKVGYLYDIVLDIEAPSDMPLKIVHNKTILLEEAIKESIPQILDIVIHTEPIDIHNDEIGKKEHKEGYGLTPKDFR